MIPRLALPDDWVLDAACGTHPDPNLWFGNNRTHNIAAAAICAHCPVKDECLTEALDSQIAYGVWGGLTAVQRASIARCVRCGAPAPANQNNPHKVRKYCSPDCRYAALSERLRTIPTQLPPQPARFGTCQRCATRFPQKRSGRPNIYCSPECRRPAMSTHRRRRTGDAS